ncbi:GNAT family N-acetyltransferase [Sphingomonas sp. JC676]|uniref:GNAT family N-acetyltransferase n=1 Tax=Sphingomonas sp. JC676 TaxID=2768065 RepID=UPI001657C348|nr:GNAT family N-acetyltransferase [Sphingomonas sp. JC676]MBC9031638.1 GNAT family N-acetyltransferase [Sphingomonas sp. JC676]
MIETERLLLRPWTADDRRALGDLVNTPAMTAHLGGVRSETEIDAMLERRLRDQARHGHCYWAAELRGEGTLIGSCGIRLADDYPGAPVEGMPEIGWRVGERYWGQGFAREAAEASIAWGWANLAADAIGAWTTARNKASWGLMRRLGMERRDDLDFHHPRYAADDMTGAMVVYLLERPQ